MPNSSKQQDAKVNISGKSDSYDKLMEKVSNLNAKLAKEVAGVKNSLEELNPVYDQLAHSVERYAKALNAIKPIKNTRSSNREYSNPPSSSRGSSNSLDLEMQGLQRLAQAKQDLQSKQQKAEKVYNSQRLQNFKTLYTNVSNLSSIVKGKADLNTLVGTGLKAVKSSAGSLTSTLASTSAKGISATSAIAGMGGAALTATTVVAGLAVGVVALTAAMAKLGSEGYKSMQAISNTQLVLGSSYKSALGYAERLEKSTGVAVDRTMQLVSQIAQVGRASGMSTESASNMGIGISKLATNISYTTGQNLESVVSDFQQAIETGANSTGKFGINMDDNAVKYFLLQKGAIQSMNVEISESQMQYARLMFIMQQASLVGYQNAEASNTVTARFERMKNTLDATAKRLKAVFLPVFEWLVGILDKASRGLYSFASKVFKLAGIKMPKFSEDVGPTAKSIDNSQKFYSSMKKNGDELKKLEGQLYGFDEVITMNPFEPALGKVNLNDVNVDGSLDNLTKGIDKKGEKDGKAWGKKFADATRNILKNIVDKLPEPLSKPISAFLNLEGKEWDKMSNYEKMMHDPQRWYVELKKKGDATVWDLLTATVLKGLHSIPIVAALEAVLEGQYKEALLQVLAGPLAWQVNMQFGGFDKLENFYKKNGILRTVLKFVGLDVINQHFSKFVNWFENSIKGWGIKIADGFEWAFNKVKGFLDSIKPPAWLEEALGFFDKGKGKKDKQYKPGEPVNVNVPGGVPFFGDVLKLINLGNERYNSSLSKAGVKIPKYANGGFHIKPHLGLVGDVKEVTLPLNSSASAPAYRGIADNLLNNIPNNVGNNNGSKVEVHLGQNSTIIADNYSLKLFADKISNLVEQRLRNTGALAFNRR